MENIFLIILGYLLGSIPFGLIISKINDVDIRDHGSGNIGATNMSRIMGKKLGIVTFLLDASKGIIPLYFAKYSPEYIKYMVGFSSIIGHIFPIWLKFRGGKGVATGIAVVTFLNPLAGLLLSIFWGLIFYIFKISSLASISSFILINIYSIVFLNLKFSVFLLTTSIIIIFKHKNNIMNLINYKEKDFK